MATQVTAIATAILATGSAVTAVFAFLAFRKQSTEVTILQRQARDQADVLRIQAEQLEAQREQFHDRRKVNEKQIVVLELQSEELRTSREEREREATGRRRAQAAKVLMWEDRSPVDPRLPQTAPGYRTPTITACVSNDSDQLIYDLEIQWHKGSVPWGDPEFVVHIPAQGKEVFTRSLPADLPDFVDAAVYGAVLHFRDAAGVKWLRRPDGELSERIN
jgi:hypothetical protein